MKKIVYLFVLFFVLKGYSQRSINVYDDDILVINKPSNVVYVDNLINEYSKHLIYEDNSYSVALSSKKMFPPIPSKYFKLIRGEEIMEVFCRGFGNTNYYIKNIEFKSGKYLLEYDKGSSYDKSTDTYERFIKVLKGKDIQISKTVQDLLFVNYLNSTPPTGFERKDILFQDLPFFVIDINDVKYVKLIEVEEFPGW